ncbi:hypothetical protein E4P41_04810 [Geodermatophilus sp. DF01-2]|uniref:serine O-acetyltransferase n=1 Tax=Geodermatophilus sp. DF01-2 TaxID=2559610 RepID=UPI0010739D3E|nr:DapH/DapD/GlmU-related protein [Geodermatophilus sp. DF01_2]TFV63368.1 hypothetical protein E4P41_04810 [Geodermatophilus sp. DF01_2]
MRARRSGDTDVELRVLFNLAVVPYESGDVGATLRWVDTALARAVELGVEWSFYGVEHGYATTLTARTVGRDCRVNQQVTVGHTGRGQPVIGDRVSIGAGAVVVGPVTVGDDARIGANATVVRDVPPGAAMLAPPAVPGERRGGRPGQ